MPDMCEKRGAHGCSNGPGGLLFAVGGYDVNHAHSFKCTGAPAVLLCQLAWLSWLKLLYCCIENVEVCMSDIHVVAGIG